MEPLKYKAKNGKVYEITMERARGRKDLPYGFFFKIRREQESFCYTLAVAATIVSGENWSEEKICEHTLKKAQNLLDEGAEEKVKLLFIYIDVPRCITVPKWMSL